MSILEMILTLLILDSLGSSFVGSEYLSSKRHLVSGRMEYNERRRKSLL